MSKIDDNSPLLSDSSANLQPAVRHNESYMGYAITFDPASDSRWNVRCTAFPGMITEGDTLAEARHCAVEAIDLCIKAYRANGWPLPPAQ
jgi:predicted RNase H-like HicB family nuclease